VGRDLLAAECRRTEVLIGHLLDWSNGPTTVMTVDAQIVQVPRQDRVEFRKLAEHEALVEELLADRKVSRKVLLEKIDRRRAVEDGQDEPPEIASEDFRTGLDTLPDGGA